MIVCRYNTKTHDIEVRDKPFTLNYGTEEHIFQFDQSSTCTALIIGDMKGGVKEFITFEREKRKGEDTGSFISKMENWVKILISNVNVKCYSLEDVILTGYAQSDKVVKQVRGVVVNIYHTAHCLNENGEKVLLASNGLIEEINNREWKAMIVPKDYFDYYKDDKLAVANYIYKFFPHLSRMQQDITDALCMYLFLIKTRYGNQKLKANKSSVSYNHSVVALAFPFEELTHNHPEISALSDGKFGSKLNKEQLDFIDKYREGVVKRYISLLTEGDYNDEFISSNRDKVDYKLGLFLKMKSKEEFSEIMNDASFLGIKNEDRKVREFEFNDNLTVEENLRCFTCRDKGIYFTIVPKSLHYCYAIPMFDLQLGMQDKILVIGSKY